MLQAEAAIVQRPVPQVQEQVLAMDDLTDSSKEEPEMPPLINDLEVAMPEFPNLQNLEPFMVEEVPLYELVAFDDMEPIQPQTQGPPPGFENVQLGFVETYFPPMDPVFQQAKVSDIWTKPRVSGFGPNI